MSALTVHGKAVIYLEVGWASIPSLIRFSLFARSSWHLRSRLNSRAGIVMLRFFRVRPIDLEAIGDLPIGPSAMAGPMARALDRLDASDIGPLLDIYSARFPNAVNAAGALRSILVHEISNRAIDAFYAELWARSIGCERTIFVGTTRWDRFLLADRQEERRVVGTVSRTLASLGKGLGQVRRLAARRLVSEDPRAGRSGGGDHTIPARAEQSADWECEVLFILNNGSSYGDLYSYNYILSEDPQSPLHPTRVARMARLGGPHHPDGIHHPFPDHGRTTTWLANLGRILWESIRASRCQYSLEYLVLLSRACASADGQREWLQRRFPSIRLAILAYELQVPGTVVLALDSLGVPCVAVNERPQSTVWELQPFAVTTLLTASDFFTASALCSRSVAVAGAKAVGMWRTDLLHEYRSADTHPIWEPAMRSRLSRVVALPTHFVDGNNWESRMIGTSISSLQSFLWDMIRLARDRPSLFIVIRGKSCAWVADPRFSHLRRAVAELPNIDVSERYDQLDETYRICASAQLVIGKYTSLIDECLAVSVPSVIHDYTSNSEGLMRPVVPYLPEGVWANSYDELLVRVDKGLASDGADFWESWQPDSLRIYGDLNDGCVRARARAFMESVVATGTG